MHHPDHCICRSLGPRHSKALFVCLEGGGGQQEKKDTSEQNKRGNAELMLPRLQPKPAQNSETVVVAGNDRRFQMQHLTAVFCVCLSFFRVFLSARCTRQTVEKDMQGAG
jgi:hypothetical protein